MVFDIDKCHRVESLVEKYNIALLRYHTALRELKKITAATGEIVKSANARNAERAEELRSVIADTSRMMTVRKLAVVELEQLEATVPAMLQEERKAAAKAQKDGEQAIQELRIIIRDLREAFADARKALREANDGTLGAAYFELWERWLEGAAADFGRVAK